MTEPAAASRWVRPLAVGPVFHDEELLAERVCQHVGQPIVVLAGTRRDALRAAKAARLTKRR